MPIFKKTAKAVNNEATTIYNYKSRGTETLFWTWYQDDTYMWTMLL